MQFTINPHARPADIRLQLKITAENHINQLINSMIPRLISIAHTLVGQPIFEARFTVRPEVAEAFELPQGSLYWLIGDDMISLDTNGYSISFTFSTKCYAPDDQVECKNFFVTTVKTICIADVGVDNLISCIYVHTPLKIDYDFLTVKESIKITMEAKNTYDLAMAKCLPFI